MGMLVLNRTKGKSIVIDGDIIVTVLGVDLDGDENGNVVVVLGVDAPRDVSVNRAEVERRIRERMDVIDGGNRR